jgi:uncharacterized protein (TIGR02246 family)
MATTSPEAVAQSFASAINAGDTEAALQLWLEDAVFVAADGPPRRGRAQIRDVFAALIENGTQMRIEMAGCHVAGPVAAAHGKLTFTVPAPDGERVEASTRFTAVYARDESGVWRIAIDAPWGLAPA